MISESGEGKKSEGIGLAYVVCFPLVAILLGIAIVVIDATQHAEEEKLKKSKLDSCVEQCEQTEPKPSEETVPEEKADEEEYNRPVEKKGRDLRFNLDHGGSLAQMGENAFEASDKYMRYCKRKRWGLASGYACALADDAGIIDNKIMWGVYAALTGWNDGNVRGAIWAMDCVVELCERIGGGCENNAVKLRDAFKSRKLTGSFTVEECTQIIGVIELVYGPPAQIMRNRRGAITAYAESETRKAQFEGEMNASRARREAGAEYFRKTRDEFHPNHPPKKGTFRREQWESAKRIYDIFN